MTGKVRPVGAQAPLFAVLEVVLKGMLDTWHFSDVPASLVPEELHEALYALLDEELILRRDAPQTDAVFASGSETINFTFDEFRDFLLSEYLLNRVYSDNPELFSQYVSKTDPADNPVAEGIKRFLFYAARQPEREQFRAFYRSQSWYREVYDTEIFNIDSALLEPADREIVAAGLTEEERGRDLARRLAVRWRSDRHPILNLELLLSFVAGADDETFHRVVVEAFRTRPYSGDRVSAADFVEFLKRNVVEKPDQFPEHSTEQLFRFLIVLLPVDSNAILDSGADAVLRPLLLRRPTQILRLLVESLDYRATRHRPYVWRALSSLEARPHVMTMDLWARAIRERDGTQDPVLLTEVNRFIDLESRPYVGGVDGPVLGT